MRRRLLWMVCALALVVPLFAVAQTNVTPPSESSQQLRATVESIHETRSARFGNSYTFTAKDATGAREELDTDATAPDGLPTPIRVGQQITVERITHADGTIDAMFIGVVRSHALLFLLIAFAVVTILVGQRRGWFALGGLAVTLLVLFGFILPSMLRGWSPTLVTTIGAILILSVNMVITHGRSRTSVAALAATIAGVAIALIVSELAVRIAALTGMSQEEVTYLYTNSTTLAAPHGILLAGFLLGTVGVLDDIAITQAEAVATIADANPTLGRRALRTQAMRIGRQHIASVVNTLVLAYAGVALPLLLLAFTTRTTLTQFLDTEPVAEEIVRTIAGTITLILLVPLSTWFAAIAYTRNASSRKT